MSFKIGIDVGSTTLKTVVLNDDNNIVEKSYQRHFSKVRELTVEHLQSLAPLLEGHPLKAVITGSAGLGIAKSADVEFVQEVFATAGAVKSMLPDTDVVIELGGEDAKILFLQGTLEERMNGSCAGGTGAFIDQMATLMDVTPTELDQLSMGYEKIYPIASRCGVFAKSDIQPLLNQGARHEDIAASIFQSVVEQTITGLAQGRPIKGKVLFLGGPLSFFKGLQDRFVETLGLSAEDAIFHPLAPYFVALGAALQAEALDDSAAIDYNTLLDKLVNSNDSLGGLESQPPLFRDQREYDDFIARHAKVTAESVDIDSYSGNAYLGIDAGSTTTKVALIDEDKRILYRHYVTNGGNPVPVIREQLQKIYALCGDHIRIAGSAVTGYGEELMQAAFGIDFGLVETVAHFTAAKHFHPEVDFIIDIGGQDIKCFTIRDGTVDSVILNEACSSGCGSFIQTFAKGLGYPIEEFARLALFAEHPVDLGSRCTVFMNSSVKQAQKDGATVGDISAGLAMSVIKNALYKVIRARSADELGQHVVVQGGTFLNDAVLRAFEMELDREVVRPQVSELMGAYGAALYAMENAPEETNLITFQQLLDFTHKAVAAVCRRCTNHCALTVNTFADGRRFVSGNKCEKGAGEAEANDLPNLVQVKYEKLMNYPMGAGDRMTIGLPMVLNMYDNLPFWATFFAELNCTTVLSGQSSRNLYMKGQNTIPSDTVCYPAKLVHGHMVELLEKKVDRIFYPCMSYNFDEGISDNCYNCPVVAYYPELIKANMADVEPLLVANHLSLNDREFFYGKIFDILKDVVPNLRREEIPPAAEKAYAAMERYRDDVMAKGVKALDFAKESGLKTIILASRPYHIDPEINHGVDKLLTSLGFVVVTEDAVPYDREKHPRNVLNQWTYHARMYAAADYVGTVENTEMVQLVSFGCGLDAVTTDEVRDILREKGKLYTQLKIDEINNLGAAKIRMRSLLAAMEERTPATVKGGR
ncbi:MAG: acyl-CoA dehydratase activase [Oscillospiraceae bacterium]